MRKLTKLFILTLAGLSLALHAEEVTLDWVAGGFTDRMGYYSPQRATLTPNRPDHVTKVPEEPKGSLFATLLFGTPGAEKKVAVLIAEAEPGNSRLWLDANGNGDLTDDPAPQWGEQIAAGTWRGSASITVNLDGQDRELGVSFYRFDPNDARRASLKTTLLYYRDFGLWGTATIGGKSYRAAVSDESARGNFMSQGARIALDLNDDGKFDPRAELFSTSKPFNVGGTTYEITGLKPGANTFQIVKSQQTVAEVPVPVATKVGTKVVAFEEKTTDGTTVRFPEDYNGKVVMLDFWATWCGPCVAEVPNLSKVYADLHAKGFEILGVSLDNESTLPRLKKFTEEKGMSWPQIADGKGWEAKLGVLYGVRGIPACYLVDGTTGQLVATSNELRGGALRPTVERALANVGKPALADTAPAITKPAPAETQEPLVKKARALQDAGLLMSGEIFLKTLEKPEVAPVALRPPGTKPLRGREIAELAKNAHVRVGWVFLCTKCSKWHANLAGGYAIAKDTIVTAHHVLDTPENMKPGSGCPVIVRNEEDIIPIHSVIAADAAADTAIVRVGVEDLKPLGIAADVHVGDTVYCLSDPRGAKSYFSTGIVNRHFTREKGKTDDPRDQRLHVSTDWAQGSSGAAVLDECGNVVGHVSRIRSLMGAKQPDPHTTTNVMNLHEAVPVSCVLNLIGEQSATADGK